MLMPRRFCNSIDTRRKCRHMLLMNQAKEIALRCRSELEAKTCCLRESTTFYQLSVLGYVKFIWPSRFMLIIYHAGASAVILSQFKRQHELVTLGCAIGRWNHQPIIRINKYDIAILQLLQRPAMPFPAEHLAFRSVCTFKIKRLRIKSCLQNVRMLQGADLPFA